MSQQRGDEGQLFVSYAHEDSTVVHAICDELQDRGLRVWVDQAEVGAGDDIVERLNQGLSESKLFVAFAGPAYFERGRFTSAEYGAAFHKAMGADRWRLILVRLRPDTDLPPLAASRHYIDHTSPAETADKILRTVVRAEAWEGPVYLQNSGGVEEREKAVGARELDWEDVGDRDLEIIARTYLKERPRLLADADAGELLTFKVTLPRERRIILSLLRALVENEGVNLTLDYLIERIEICQRFEAKWTKEIDEGLLGKFDVAAEHAVQRNQEKLEGALAELRTQFIEVTEGVRIEQ